MPDPETPTTPPDPELAAAKREALLATARKERAEAEKSIAEAEQARVKAQLSPLTDQSKITAPSGDVTTTSDQAGFVETQMLAQEAARTLAERLKNRLTNAGAKTVIIYNSDVASLSAMASVLRQLDQLVDEFKLQELKTAQVLTDARSLIAGPQAAPQPEAADVLSALILGPSIVTGVVKSVAELVNLFRTTTEFKKQTVAVTEEMIVSYLVSKLGKDKTVYYPSFFPPNIETSGSTSLVALRKLNDNRILAQSRLEELAQVEIELNTKILAVSSEEEKAEFRSAIQAVGDMKSKLQLLSTIVDQLTVSLETTDPITKDKPISQLIRSERLASIMKEDKAFTLHLTVTANGTSTIRKNVFTSARVQHSAGVSLVYQLFELTGKIADAGVMQYYFDFKTAEEVRDLVERGQAEGTR